MDNITHALAGSLLAAAACRHVARAGDDRLPPSFHRTAWTLGVVMAELPDADIAYSGDWLGIGKLGYLLHHRGHTHTIIFAVVSALVAWGLALLVSRKLRAPRFARVLLALSFVASLSHVTLDFTNSYGVHPWWPLDSRWFYGDAVFIVEPWLWIVALPPLALIVRSVAPRALFGALLVVILVAAWRVDIVPPDVAVVLTVGAVAWTAISWAAPDTRRVMLALSAWLALEALFFTGGALGRRIVRNTVGPSFRDVVLSPSPGNPLCLSAIVVTEAGGLYAVTTATVAPVPALRSALSCRPGTRPGPQGATVAAYPDSPGIRWGEHWQAPYAELRVLADERCDVSAALRFLRVPIWRTSSNGDVTLFDLRFGEGESSFASIVSRPGTPCPRAVPDWEWPRADVLGDVMDYALDVE